MVGSTARTQRGWKIQCQCKRGFSCVYTNASICRLLAFFVNICRVAVDAPTSAVLRIEGLQAFSFPGILSSHPQNRVCSPSIYTQDGGSRSVDGDTFINEKCEETHLPALSPIKFVCHG